MKNIGLMMMVLLATVVEVNAGVSKELAPFDEFKVSGNFEVILVKSDRNEISFKFHKGNITNVSVDIDAYEVSVAERRRFTGQQVSATITLYYTDLEELRAGEGAVITAKETVNADYLKLKADAGGNINLTVDAKDLWLETNKGGTIDIAGNCTAMRVKCATGGQLNALQLMAAEADVRIISGGLAEVHTADSLDVSIKMGGKVRYMGEPKSVNTSTVMGGKVEAIQI